LDSSLVWVSSRRLLLVALAAAAATVLLAPSANAYRVRIDNGKLVVDRATTEDAGLDLFENPPNIVAHDHHPGNKVNAGSGCAQVAEDRVHCPASSVSSVVANLGAFPDTLNGQGGCAGCMPLSRPMSVDFGNGNDEAFGGNANDVLNGQVGDDLLAGGFGSDTIIGGPGNDVASYSDLAHNGPVTVVLDGFPPDGAPGENDSIALDVEGARGTRFGDTLIGSVGKNTLDGMDAPSGAQGSDTLRGNSGNDTIDATGGKADTISCGAGNDKASLDLVDAIPPDCEDISQAAVGQHPTVGISHGAARVRGGRALRVRLECPRKLRRGCRGKLTLRDAAGRSLGSRRYRRIRRGRNRRVVVALNARGRRARRITAVASERDANGKPKTTIPRLRG
jgi:hypothetical protein